jgi:hypothetical protein
MGETLTLTLETADEDGDFTATVTVDLHHRGSYNEPVPRRVHPTGVRRNPREV